MTSIYSAPIAITRPSDIANLPDGTLLRWRCVPGDPTSDAIAFLRKVEHERGGDQGGVTTTEIWISPGNGWEPEDIDCLVFPVEIIATP